MDSGSDRGCVGAEIPFHLNYSALVRAKDSFVRLEDEAIAARREAKTELAGVFDAGQAAWLANRTRTQCGGGPSGKVKRAAFEWFCNPIVAAVERGRFDGAMVLDFCEDGDGEILRRIRVSCGNETPIAITLDRHANVSQQMCSLADIMLSFRTYPHIDMRETGEWAGQILQRTMAGEITPHTIRVGRPMLEESYRRLR